MICKRIVSTQQFLNEPELVCFHIVKCVQVLLSNTNIFYAKKTGAVEYIDCIIVEE